MPVQHVKTARVGSKAQPKTFIVFATGRNPIETPADVTSDMRWDLRDILHVPMRIHFQGTTQYTTPGTRDLDKLIDACFSMNNETWKTGDPHDPPDSSMVDGGVDSVSVLVATLLTEMGAVSKVKGHDKAARKDVVYRLVNRGEDSPMVMRKEPKQKISEHRLACSRVYMSLKPNTERVATFKFYDGAHKVFPEAFVPRNLAMPFQTLTQARTYLMQKYERFWMNNGRRYNVLIAIYIARNGGRIGQVPDGEVEAKKLFHRYTLVRNMVVPGDCIAGRDEIKALPLPKLFHGIPSD